MDLGTTVSVHVGDGWHVHTALALTATNCTRWAYARRSRDGDRSGGERKWAAPSRRWTSRITCLFPATPRPGWFMPVPPREASLGTMEVVGGDEMPRGWRLPANGDWPLDGSLHEWLDNARW